MRSVAFSFLLTAFLLLGESAQAISYENLSGENTALECLIERDDPKNIGEVIPEKIYAFGVKTLDGSLRFSLIRENIPTFFFRRDTDIPQVTWHSRAKINIQAMLKNEELTYIFQFYNYLYWEDQVRPLFMEKRRIDVSGYQHTPFEFHNDEARLLDYQSKDERFVNERGAKLINCSLQNLNYKSYFYRPLT